MATILQLRSLAETSFAEADAMIDSSAQDRMRSRGYELLQRAASLERQEAERALGRGQWAATTPVQNAALVQLARVQGQIDAIAAERPPERSARANILAVLYRKKAELEEVLAVVAPEASCRRRKAGQHWV